VKKSDEYLQHAKDCRRLARQMEVGEQRDQLMKMAETWEVLAIERGRNLRNNNEDEAAASPADASQMAPWNKPFGS
jgi:hypothetical protein